MKKSLLFLFRFVLSAGNILHYIGECHSLSSKGVDEITLTILGVAYLLVLVGKYWYPQIVRHNKTRFKLATIFLFLFLTFLIVYKMISGQLGIFAGLIIVLSQTFIEFVIVPIIEKRIR